MMHAFTGLARYALASLVVVQARASETCTGKDSEPLAAQQARALLQSRHDIHAYGADSSTANARTEAPVTGLQVEKRKANHKEIMKINPSGAAAPLTSDGYFAVADRCCQAEMKQFIERQLYNLGLQKCEESGLAGIVHYHTCPLGPQTFDKLTADLLADSKLHCRWLAPAGETCADPFPEDCPTFEGLEPADCGCSRGAAAKLDIAAATIPANNLQSFGVGSIRYSSGVSSAGEPFDLVVTANDGYLANNLAKNGKQGSFGVINIKVNTTTTFRFSIVRPGTDTPLTLAEVHMATFDLDGTHQYGLESVSSKGYHGYVTDANPTVVASLEADGRTRFTGTGAGDIHNPSNPNSLTSVQRRNSVMYFYKDVASFELIFVATGGTDDFGVDLGGRNIFFAFETALDDRCAP